MQVLEHPEQKAVMEREAWAFGRTSQWSEVARRYEEVFCKALAPPAPRRLLAHASLVEVA